MRAGFVALLGLPILLASCQSCLDEDQQAPVRSEPPEPRGSAATNVPAKHPARFPLLRDMLDAGSGD